MKSDAYAIIMAGGKGERFWPLSTAKCPKQLVSLFGGKPLLTQAVERLAGVIPPENVFVITKLISIFDVEERREDAIHNFQAIEPVTN